MLFSYNTSSAKVLWALLGRDWVTRNDRSLWPFSLSWYKSGLPIRSTNIMASRFPTSMNNVRADLPTDQLDWPEGGYRFRFQGREPFWRMACIRRGDWRH